MSTRFKVRYRWSYRRNLWVKCFATFGRNDDILPHMMAPQFLRPARG